MIWLLLFACAGDTDVVDTDLPAPRDCGATTCTGGEFCLHTSPGDGGDPVTGCAELPEACAADQTCGCIESLAGCTSCADAGGFVRCDIAYP